MATPEDFVHGCKSYNEKSSHHNLVKEERIKGPIKKCKLRETIACHSYRTVSRLRNLFWFLSSSCFFLSILASRFASSEAMLSNI